MDSKPDSSRSSPADVPTQLSDPPAKRRKLSPKGPVVPLLQPTAPAAPNANPQSQSPAPQPRPEASSAPGTPAPPPPPPAVDQEPDRPLSDYFPAEVSDYPPPYRDAVFLIARVKSYLPPDMYHDRFLPLVRNFSADLTDAKSKARHSTQIRHARLARRKIRSGLSELLSGRQDLLVELERFVGLGTKTLAEEEAGSDGTRDHDGSISATTVLKTPAGWCWSVDADEFVTQVEQQEQQEQQQQQQQSDDVSGGAGVDGGGGGRKETDSSSSESESEESEEEEEEKGGRRSRRIRRRPTRKRTKRGKAKKSKKKSGKKKKKGGRGKKKRRGSSSAAARASSSKKTRRSRRSSRRGSIGGTPSSSTTTTTRSGRGRKKKKQERETSPPSPATAPPTSESASIPVPVPLPVPVPTSTTSPLPLPPQKRKPLSDLLRIPAPLPPKIHEIGSIPPDQSTLLQYPTFMRPAIRFVALAKMRLVTIPSSVAGSLKESEVRRRQKMYNELISLLSSFVGMRRMKERQERRRRSQAEGEEGEEEEEPFDFHLPQHPRAQIAMVRDLLKCSGYRDVWNAFVEALPAAVVSAFDLQPLSLLRSNRGGRRRRRHEMPESDGDFVPEYELEDRKANASLSLASASASGLPFPPSSSSASVTGRTLQPGVRTRIVPRRDKDRRQGRGSRGKKKENSASEPEEPLTRRLRSAMSAGMRRNRKRATRKARVSRKSMIGAKPFHNLTVRKVIKASTSTTSHDTVTAAFYLRLVQCTPFEPLFEFLQKTQAFIADRDEDEEDVVAYHRAFEAVNRLAAEDEREFLSDCFEQLFKERFDGALVIPDVILRIVSRIRSLGPSYYFRSKREPEKVIAADSTLHVLNRTLIQEGKFRGGLAPSSQAENDLYQIEDMITALHRAIDLVNSLIKELSENARKFPTRFDFSILRDLHQETLRSLYDDVVESSSDSESGDDEEEGGWRRKKKRRQGKARHSHSRRLPRLEEMLRSSNGPTIYNCLIARLQSKYESLLRLKNAHSENWKMLIGETFDALALDECYRAVRLARAQTFSFDWIRQRLASYFRCNQTLLCVCPGMSVHVVLFSCLLCAHEDFDGPLKSFWKDFVVPLFGLSESLCELDSHQMRPLLPDEDLRSETPPRDVVTFYGHTEFAVFVKYYLNVFNILQSMRRHLLSRPSFRSDFAALLHVAVVRVSGDISHGDFIGRLLAILGKRYVQEAAPLGLAFRRFKKLVRSIQADPRTPRFLRLFSTFGPLGKTPDLVSPHYLREATRVSDPNSVLTCVEYSVLSRTLRMSILRRQPTVDSPAARAFTHNVVCRWKGPPQPEPERFPKAHRHSASLCNRMRFVVSQRTGLMRAVPFTSDVLVRLRGSGGEEEEDEEEDEGEGRRLESVTATGRCGPGCRRLERFRLLSERFLGGARAGAKKS